MISRDILFVITAFQNNLIDRQQLIDAFSEWVKNQSISMREVLVRQKALQPNECDLVERMVDMQQQRQPESLRSIALFSSMPTLQSELAEIASQAGAHDIHTTLFSSVTDFPDAPSTDAGWWGSGMDRFRIVKEHARGGLGVVLMAEDKQFRREVACKQIRPDRADLEPYRHKFKREAEITGQLEHPGIVPIYALGTDKDGRPFYVMRFIRGERLHDGIAAFHSRLKQGSVRFDSPQLRQLLRHFTDTCNAVEYAHQQGILHRDLKPENVMLGRYGETLVVDWGLAKKLSPASSEPVEFDLTCSISGTEADPSEASATRDGTFVGTAAFASPEQLLGQLNKLSPASDVYSLGAVLFSILTGRPPIEKAANLAEAVRQIEQLQPSSLKDLRGDIPQPLVFICLKALSSQAQDRYPTAAALRDAIQLWLDDQAIPGMPEGLPARLIRWTRKHQTLAATGLVGLVATLILSATVTLVTQGYLERERKQAVELREANDRERSQRSLAEQSRLDLLLSSAQSARDHGDFRTAVKSLREYQVHRKLNTAQILSLTNDLYNADDFQSASALIGTLDRGQLSPAQMAQINLVEGELLLYSDNPSSGIELIQQSADSKLLPAAEQAFARALLAESALECRAELHECLRLSPNHIAALTNLVFTCMAVGNYNEAKDQLQYGLAVFPDEPRFLFSQSLLASVMGDQATSAATMAKLKQLGTHEYLLRANQSVADLYAFLNARVPQLAQGKYVFGFRDATELASLALELRNASEQARVVRGVSSLPQNRWLLKLPNSILTPMGLAAAIAPGGFERIVQTYRDQLPNNQFLNYVAGCMLMLKDRYAEAGELLLHAAECDPSATACARESVWAALTNLTMNSVNTGQPIALEHQLRLRRLIHQHGQPDGKYNVAPVPLGDAWRYLVRTGMHEEARAFAQQQHSDSTDPTIQAAWQTRLELLTAMESDINKAVDTVVRTAP